MDMLIWYQVVADRKDITLNRAPLSGIGRREAPFSWPHIRGAEIKLKRGGDGWAVKG